MEHYDFVCDEGLTSLRILQRNPRDSAQPLESLRVHVRCTDCVAALDVDADNWAGFVRLFTHDYESCGSAAWLSPAGEWKLHLEADGGAVVVTSVLDSLLNDHRWVVQTRFKMSADRFRATSRDLLEFLGVWQ